MDLFILVFANRKDRKKLGNFVRQEAPDITITAEREHLLMLEPGSYWDPWGYGPATRLGKEMFKIQDGDGAIEDILKEENVKFVAIEILDVPGDDIYSSTGELERTVKDTVIIVDNKILHRQNFWDHAVYNSDGTIDERASDVKRRIAAHKFFKNAVEIAEQRLSL
jgi:hypothetical protein